MVKQQRSAVILHKRFESDATFVHRVADSLGSLRSKHVQTAQAYKYYENDLTTKEGIKQNKQVSFAFAIANRAWLSSSVQVTTCSKVVIAHTTSES